LGWGFRPQPPQDKGGPTNYFLSLTEPTYINQPRVFLFISSHGTHKLGNTRQHRNPSNQATPKLLDKNFSKLQKRRPDNETIQFFKVPATTDEMKNWT
jgi:hypothetical protein